MPSETAAVEKPNSQFQLLLWLKFRLIWGAMRRDRASAIGSVIALIIFMSFSVMFSFSVYQYAVSAPSLFPFVLRDTLAAAYFIWFFTPLLGFSLNESYDPMRLFIYPVRYQTIFSANVVGSLFELSTLVVAPILIALTAATAASPVGCVLSALLLLIFLLQTVAMGQAVTLVLLRFLQSRRFRDIMIVVFPMIALARYFFTPQFTHGADIETMLRGPIWRIADFLPPGWTAIAIESVQSGNWLHAAAYTALLMGAAALTVAAGAGVLRLLYRGERGSNPTAVKPTAVPIRPVNQTALNERGPRGAWIPILAVAEKESRYVVRDPQFKALGMNALYMLAVCFFSLFRVIGDTDHSGSGRALNLMLTESWVPIVASIGVSSLLLFGAMPLIFNIFGGEGPAITVLLSFPTPRIYFVFGKNIVHGALVICFGLIGIGACSYFLHSYDNLPLGIVWLMMSTLVILAAGNLVSVRLPTKFIVRGGRISRGGQVSVGASRGFGSGCAYGLIYLLCWIAAAVAEIPAAAAVIIPSVGWLSTQWYWLTLPLGIVYSAALYLLSLKLISIWMTSRELDIITKLAPTD